MHRAKAQTAADVEQPLIGMALESWRFAKVFGHVVARLDVAESGRYANQMRYFLRRVDEMLALLELRIVNLEGQLYDPGMAVTPLNLNDFESCEELVIEQMVEPVVMGSQGLVKAGTVLLKRAKGSSA